MLGILALTRFGKIWPSCLSSFSLILCSVAGIKLVKKVLWEFRQRPRAPPTYGARHFGSNLTISALSRVSSTYPRADVMNLSSLTAENRC